MGKTILTKHSKVYFEKWLDDHEPFGPWGSEKFDRFLATLIFSRRKRIDKDIFINLLNNSIMRDDKDIIIRKAVQRFELIRDFYKNTSGILDFKYGRSYVSHEVQKITTFNTG